MGKTRAVKSVDDFARLRGLLHASSRADPAEAIAFSCQVNDHVVESTIRQSRYESMLRTGICGDEILSRIHAPPEVEDLLWAVLRRGSTWGRKGSLSA